MLKLRFQYGLSFVVIYGWLLYICMAAHYTGWAVIWVAAATLIPIVYLLAAEYRARSLALQESK